jgi:hypothetical protein
VGLRRGEGNFLIFQCDREKLKMKLVYCNELHYIMSIMSFEPKIETDSSVRALLLNAARYHDAGHTEIFRTALTTSLRGWLDDEKTKSQRNFWQLYDELRSSTINFSKIAEELNWNYDLSNYIETEPKFEISLPTAYQYQPFISYQAHFDFADYCIWDNSLIEPYRQHNLLLVEGKADADLFRTDWVLAHNSFIVDGQQHSTALQIWSREISAKATRRAFKAALREIELFSNDGSVVDLVRLFGLILSREISNAVRLSVRICIAQRRLPVKRATTRDRVLNFSIHTGNPPPLGRTCPAVGWALVRSANAQRGRYESIPMRQSSRNLRNAVQRGYSPTRLGRSAQDHARLGRGTQSARCRRARTDFPLPAYA